VAVKGRNKKACKGPKQSQKYGQEELEWKQVRKRARSEGGTEVRGGGGMIVKIACECRWRRYGRVHRK